ncbi:MAG: hypothetical protein AAF747_11610, partial [Planctomycetota bacterium]
VDEELTPSGQSMPEFVGGLTSYVTRWNGLHVVGLDAAGDVWGVWSGNGGQTWFVNNLSDITGAPSYSSELTVFISSWDGIHIAGLDDSGEVLATWWTPALVGEWVVTSLTDTVGGDVFFAGSTITSYIAFEAGLNVIGLNDAGELIGLFWTPGREEAGLGWGVANLTAELSVPTADRPVANLDSRIFADELNIFGTAADDDVVRFSFDPSDDAWTFSNVTDDAIPS